MSTAKEIGFEGHLPSSIKPDGFHCRRHSGCNREALCVGEGECLGVDPRHSKTSPRNRFNEIAEHVRALTYTEMIEFSRGLWRLRGEGKLNSETLPKILHAWATASDRTVRHEPAPPAGGYDGPAEKEFRPIEFRLIDSAPKDRPILAFMLGQWRVARWKPKNRKQPAPFWSADDLRVTDSREHQPKWWADLPSSPPETTDEPPPGSSPAATPPA
jgi:hypothetical protein